LKCRQAFIFAIFRSVRLNAGYSIYFQRLRVRLIALSCRHFNVEREAFLAQASEKASNVTLPRGHRLDTRVYSREN